MLLVLSKAVLSWFAFFSAFHFAPCSYYQIPERGQPEADPYVRAVCFSPDGRCVVAGMEKNSAKVLVLGDEGGQHGAITLSGHEVRRARDRGRDCMISVPPEVRGIAVSTPPFFNFGSIMPPFRR